MRKWIELYMRYMKLGTAESRLIKTHLTLVERDNLKHRWLLYTVTSDTVYFAKKKTLHIL